MRQNRRATEYVVWHCSATSPDKDIGAAQIQVMHKARGFSDIGYGLVIRRDGRCELGEDLKKTAAHVKGLNSVSVGICMVGGVDEDGNAENNFTDEQWKAAKHVYEFFTLLFPDAKHVGHRDLSPDLDGDGRVQRHEFLKDCPCYSVSQWIEGGLQPVADLYAPWEESGSDVEPADSEITFEEVLDESEDDWEDDDVEYELDD